MNKIEIMELFLAQKGLCFYCLRPMGVSTNDKRTGFTKDHFIPQVYGGKTNGNIVLAHKLCNNVKGHRFPSGSEAVRFRELYKKITQRKKDLKKVKKDHGGGRAGKNGSLRG